MTDWDAGGWIGARRAQEDAWRATSPEQRLAWLEDAVEFVRMAAGGPQAAVSLPAETLEGGPVRPGV